MSKTLNQEVEDFRLNAIKHLKQVMHRGPVREFHEAFDHPIEITPTVPPIELRVLRVRLLLEELLEFADAAGVDVAVWKSNGTHCSACTTNPDSIECDLVECADALGDIRYVVDGSNLVFGFPGEAILSEIHRSNMSKLGEDGKPVKREDGKILKGPNYSKPNIATILKDYQ
jgi:predicted HAD superfamily Cof-like phosphohydrolase